MKTAFEKLECPYLNDELEFVVLTNELSDSLTHAIDECPFTHLLGVPGTEMSQSMQSGPESQEAEMLEFDEPSAETWTEEETECEEESAYLDPEADSDPALRTEGGLTGGDDRREVRDTTISPYRWVCSIAYEKDGQTLDGGTGLLISNRHVLTAAHVITDARLGEPNASSLVVYPGRHYDGEPFGRYEVVKTRVPKFRLDFGLITLNRSVDPSLLWWGHPSTNTDWWSEAAIPLQDLRQMALPITTAGFPGAKDAYRRKMYEAQGVTVPATFGGVFRHTADTTQGQSGSPVWTERGGRRILIGIVSAYDRLPNQIAVFAHDTLVQRRVRNWMAEDAPRPRPVERRIAIEIPYRWVCRIEVYDNDLKRNVGFGTGLLISDKHVLTSASVIHGPAGNARKYSILVTPGYEFGKEAFGSTTASKARVSSRFSPKTNDASADFGLLTLKRPLGSATFSSIKNAALGNWSGPNYGLATSTADWSGRTAHIAAFSRASGGGSRYQKLRVSSDGFAGLQQGQILHRAGSKLDAPGAPIWVEGDGRKLLVGIASPIFSKDSDVNCGCYLSQETRSHLMQWINEDFERKELEAGEQFSQDEIESLLASSDDEAEAWAAETYPEPELQDELLEAESSAGLFRDADAERFTKPADDAGELQGEESGAPAEGEIIGAEIASVAGDALVFGTVAQREEAGTEAGELYSNIHEYEHDQSEEFFESSGTAGLRSDEVEVDLVAGDAGGKESQKDEEESVEAELEKQKQDTKKSSLHTVLTTDIFMHVYFPKLDVSYTDQQYFDWVVDQKPGEFEPNRFQQAGVEITLVNNSKTAVADLKSSLKSPGAVVVYFGHTVLAPRTTLGLSPADRPSKKPAITCEELVRLLGTAKAKIVVLAGCATSDCVKRIKGDTIVIVTQSGKDRLTNTLQWAPAIRALLDGLLDGKTSGDALDSANKTFRKVSSTDSFKMINGDRTVKML